MTTYKSINGMEFSNAISLALDNETKIYSFYNLYWFAQKHYPESWEEWKTKRNFIGFTYDEIEQTLQDIEVLKG